MAKTDGIKVRKELYEWAIKESQKELEEIKERFENIEEWIFQKSNPTFRQLERLANYLKIPFGYMFLDKPPESDIIEGEFRTIGNKIPNISKNLKDIIYEMSRKQNWISGYRKDNGWDKVILNRLSDLNIKNCIESAKKAKEFLELDDLWYKNFKEYRVAYNFLREKIEHKGIIVMQNGIVGSNTHRKLDIDEFRGFMLYDDFAPLIFINTNDSQAGKIFTLIHEYIHILFREDDVFRNKDLNINDGLENEVNKITAEFLMPKDHIFNYCHDKEKNLERIEEGSKLFNVSKLALAIRLKELGLISQSLVNTVQEVMEKSLENKRDASTGGDYWTTYQSRYSNQYVETVIQGAESGDISYTYAFKLLDIKAKNYDILKENLIRYG